MLDEEKAYDSVDHHFLMLALEEIGVPWSMRELINGCYQDSMSTVMVNRTESKPFRLELGVQPDDTLRSLESSSAEERFGGFSKYQRK